MRPGNSKTPGFLPTVDLSLRFASRPSQFCSTYGRDSPNTAAPEKIALQHWLERFVSVAICDGCATLAR